MNTMTNPVQREHQDHPEEVPRDSAVKNLWGAVFAHYLRFEHHLAALFFVFGFVGDIILFAMINFALRYTIMAAYLILATTMILSYQYRTKGKHNKGWSLRAAPFVIQFSFGAVMSALFVTFFQSAALIQSWVFLGVLLFLLIGNEFFRDRYHQLEFQVTILFVSLFAYMIVIMPTWTHTIGTAVFLASTGVTAGIMALFFVALLAINKRALMHSVVRISGITATIACMVTILYLGRLIPPIPLVLVDAGVFHFVERGDDGTYRMYEEKEEVGFIPRFRHTLSVTADTPAYFFSAVFAPATLTAPLAHEWQQQNMTGKWETKMLVNFPIQGGRKGGYRAYSEKTVTPGIWRVLVRTNTGEVLGAYRFTAVGVSSLPTLYETFR